MAETNLPKIALGAWAWGNDGTFGGGIDLAELRPIFDTAMDAGLNLWDTAYAYGMGTSERALAGLLEGLPRDSYLVSDKLTPQCLDATAADPVAAMHDMQLELMGLDRFDIYWVHNVSEAPRWTRALAEFFEGRDDAPVIGVSNHNLAEIKEADAILCEHGLRLGAVQNHLSLVNRSSIGSGILDWCRENDVTFFSYMVLEQGALSGKYDTAHPMPEGSARAAAYNPVLDKLEVLNARLAEVAEAHGVGVAQVPVALAIAKGTLPIVGVTKASHVADAAAAAAVELTDAEVAGLEELADTLGINAIRFWEKVMD
jgi:aryl-alcohol dehydrogenase-like predicted oxidoreductase